MRLLSGGLRRLKLAPSSTMSASSSASPPLAAVLQLQCTADKVKNLETATDLIMKAKDRGASMAFLPEAFDFIGSSSEETMELAETLEGDTITKYRKLAERTGMMLSLGGFHEKTSSGLIKNTHVLLGGDGSIRETYSKTHLFDAEVPGKFRLRESDYVQPGDKIASPVITPLDGLKVGLGVCYDLRFPEFSLLLSRAGAHILTYPSAFTVATGKAHWETLLRARAIETQCYVVAAAQTGQHNAKRSSYGHAMVVDPWGEVFADCGEDVGMAMAEIRKPHLESVRRNMPVWEHRRSDLYSLSSRLSETEEVEDSQTFDFGPSIKISGSSVVFQTRYCYCSVNRKPVLPGHLLVIPKRQAKRYGDMTPAEMADFGEAVRQAQQLTEGYFSSPASTLSIQDGPEAGQSVPHVHMHVLPRRPGDFEENDQVYDALQKHDKDVLEHEWRTEEEMAEEAKKLRAFRRSLM